MFIAGVLLFGGAGVAGGPTTVTVVVNGSVKQSGVSGTVKTRSLSGSVSKRGITGTIRRGLTATIKDGLAGTVGDGNLDGGLK